MGLELPMWDVSTVAWTVVTLGLVGASVLDRFLDDGSDDDDASGGGDDIFGGGGDGMDGDMGGGDFDDFDEMDEWDDEFGDGDDAGGAATDELENRLDDLEAEVATLSSTVSTVRSENEEISATVEETEEDIRNLLDIYEMVTRGINPFVDESSGFAGGGAEGSFGLFDDDEDEDEPALDEDVANADPDGFFDEELVEPDDGGFDDADDPFGDDADGDFDDADDPFDEGPSDELDDGEPADAASETDPADDDDDMNDDGKSFSELKAEYDAGEADWADDAGDASPDDDPGEPADEDPFGDDFGADEDPFGDDLNADENGDAGGGFDDAANGLDTAENDADAAENGDAGGLDDATNGTDDARRDRATGATEPAPGGDPADANGDGFEYVERDDLSSPRRKPYLTELPGDYVGDLLVMEWLEFLVSESDVTDAVRAINYYERIEWVGPDAAARLREFLSGFGTVDRNVVDRPGTDRLVREHHTRSLRYITQLNGTDSHLMLLDRWDDLAGGSLVGGDPPTSSDASRSRDRRGHRSNGDAHADRGRNGGGSGRPMTDPDPHPDRVDPADTGWGDGR